MLADRCRNLGFLNSRKAFKKLYFFGVPKSPAFQELCFPQINSTNCIRLAGHYHSINEYNRQRPIKLFISEIP